MNENLNQNCDRLREAVKSAETCLARVGQHLVSPESTPLANWEALLLKATTQCKAEREPARQADQRVRVWLEEMEHEAAAPLDETNLDGEILKAENQADREESLALDALKVSAHAALQAEVAVLQALKTRKTAFDLARFRNVF